jgi:TonB family protein
MRTRVRAASVGSLGAARALGAIVSMLFATTSFAQGASDTIDPGAQLIEAPEKEQAAPESLPLVRSEISSEIARHIDDGDFARASTLADHLLALSLAELGARDPRLATAYVQVADIQSRNGQFEDAELNALRGVDILREVEEPYSESLIQPLLVLGDNYQRSGDPLTALSVFSEARTVSRRVHGLHNAGQIEILDRISECYVSLNRFAEADSHQREALELMRRGREPHSLEAIDAGFRYALWLRDKHHFTQERGQYFLLQLITEKHYPPDSALLARVRQERANSFRTQGAPAITGMTDLREALAILESQERPDLLAVAEILRDIGDWETAFDNVSIVDDAYLRSWQLLGNVERGESIREEWYAPTVMVYAAPLDQSELSTNPGDPAGHVLAHFDVDEHGRTSNIAVVESVPRGLLDAAVVHHVEKSRFRPAIVDGAFVPQRRAVEIPFRYPEPDR